MTKRLLLAILFITGISYSTFGQNFYLGVGTESDPQNTSCASCHKTDGIATPVYNQWKNTRHAVAQDAVTNPYYGYDCLKCHNTGWDPNTVNYGADEYVIKDTTQTPNYTITDQTGWNRVKNIGCESCHGPMGNADNTLAFSHWLFGTQNKPNYAAQVCGDCHQDSHHPYMEEWSSSLHAMSANQAFVVNNKRCVKCHVAQNFVMYAKDPENYRDTILVTGADIQPLTCVTCHDPHANNNPGQLRFPTTQSTSICDKCHTSGIDTVNVNVVPHHATSEAFDGSLNFGYRYPGQTYQNSAHTYAIQNRCITCHVMSSPSVGGAAAKTGHTFEPRVEACKQCHNDYYTAVDTSNHLTRFDYRGIQSKTDSLMNALSTKLANASSADSATLAFKQANYNLLSAQAEGSRGIHNTRLVQKLLRDAINNFGPVGVENEFNLPVKYELSQNYPNPFNPATQIKFALPESGQVTLKIYDAIGKEVGVLVNEHKDAGTHVVNWSGKSFASGIYFYSIEVNNFKMVKKMLLVK
jgi:predicted CXXCH cytochrome family protein